MRLTVEEDRESIIEGTEGGRRLRHRLVPADLQVTEPLDRGVRVTPPRDEQTARLLDDVAAIEDRLDPGPAKRGQLLADLFTLALIGVLWTSVEYPLLLVALLVAARGLHRLLPALTHRSLRRRRDQLLGRDPSSLFTIRRNESPS